MSPSRGACATGVFMAADTAVVQSIREALPGFVCLGRIICHNSADETRRRQAGRFSLPGERHEVQPADQIVTSSPSCDADSQLDSMIHCLQRQPARTDARCAFAQRIANPLVAIPSHAGTPALPPRPYFSHQKLLIAATDTATL